MPTRLPLLGVRVHLSGSIPDSASPDAANGISSFVTLLAEAVFREGATLIHGSHPTFQEPLAAAAKSFVKSGGQRDALTFVRAQKYAVTPEQFAEIDAQREFALVQIVPASYSKPNESLVPMREWMAERCDVVVAVGGKHWDSSKVLAGVPDELEETLRRGKPGFLVASFGGAIAGYCDENEEVYSRLHNGLSKEHNKAFAKNKDVEGLVAIIISQLKLLPLVRENVERGRNFRILALDGGGLRGAFTAGVLAKWEAMIENGGGDGKNLIKHFDLVAGTSTGAILAIGLGLGFSPGEMLSFYREEGPKMFPKDRKLRHWLRSKYESHTLKSILQSRFGSRKLTPDSCCRLVIPTVRALHGESEAIVTAHSLDRVAFSSMLAVDAALASSAAPTYFDEATWENPIVSESYLDGGVWANNPVLPAIAEAVRHLKIPLDRLDVLSVGTMGNEADFSKALGEGLAGWARYSADLFFAAQEHAAASLADSFLSPARHLRVNQPTPERISLDDADPGVIQQMIQRGSNVGQDSFIAVRSRFLDGFHTPDWREDLPKQKATRG